MEKIIFEGKPSSKLEFTLLIFLCWLIFPIYLYGKKIIINLTTSYKLSSQDFFKRSGIFSIKEEHLELARVRDMRLEKPFLLRILGLANIILITTDTTSPLEVIRQIDSGEASKIISQLKMLVKTERKNIIKEVDVG